MQDALDGGDGGGGSRLGAEGANGSSTRGRSGALFVPLVAVFNWQADGEWQCMEKKTFCITNSTDHP